MTRRPQKWAHLKVVPLIRCLSPLSSHRTNTWQDNARCKEGHVGEAGAHLSQLWKEPKQRSQVNLSKSSLQNTMSIRPSLSKVMTLAELPDPIKLHRACQQQIQSEPI